MKRKTMTAKLSGLCETVFVFIENFHNMMMTKCDFEGILRGTRMVDVMFLDLQSSAMACNGCGIPVESWGCPLYPVFRPEDL